MKNLKGKLGKISFEDGTHRILLFLNSHFDDENNEIVNFMNLTKNIVIKDFSLDKLYKEWKLRIL